MIKQIIDQVKPEKRLVFKIFFVKIKKNNNTYEI